MVQMVTETHAGIKMTPIAGFYGFGHFQLFMLLVANLVNKNDAKKTDK